MAKFQPGQSGNPAGRTKGARNKLGEEFIEALYADFTAHGPAVIERVRLEKPDAYLKVVASLLPREIDVRVSELESLSDEELDQRIKTIAAALDLKVSVN